MRNLVRAFVIAFFVGIFAYGVAAGVPKPPQGTGSVVQLFVEVEGERQPICTGFVINQPKKLVMTAAHCVPEHATVPIIILGGRTEPVLVNRGADVAVLKVFDRDLPVSLKPNPTVWQKSGEKGYSLGFAGGYGLKVLQMEIVLPLALVAGMETPVIVWLPDVRPGMSGGPFLKDGQVVGVVSSMHEKGHLSLTIPMRILYELTADHWEHKATAEQMAVPVESGEVPEAQ